MDGSAVRRRAAAKRADGDGSAAEKPRAESGRSAGGVCLSGRDSHVAASV